MPKKGHHPQNRAVARKKRPAWQFIGALVIVAGLVYWYWASGNSAQQNAAQNSGEPVPASLQNRMILYPTPRHPRPATLDPASFISSTNREVFEAYEVAKEVPEVLEQMPCYCGCFISAGHRNNLDCFHDTHGTGCALCRGIALEAKREHDQGISIAQIKRAIDEQWAPKIR